jgi:hypothetical protein
MSSNAPLILSLRGATPTQVVASAVAAGWLPETEPSRLVADPGREPWLARFERTKVDAWASWGNPDEPSVSVAHSQGCTVLTSRERRAGEAVLQQLERIPFSVAVFSSVHPEWRKPFPGYRAPTFGEMLPPHGWACAFRGPGHERLVSRRWLAFGPWRLHERNGDLSILEFHDAEADAAAALAQATPGHRRAGATDEGGYIQPGFVYKAAPRGLYDKKTGLLKVVVAGRALTQRELLEACALRVETRNVDPGPISNVAYIFVEEEEARESLHELWLRGLECRTLRDGVEIRLDKDYTPVPTRPVWA